METSQHRRERGMHLTTFLAAHQSENKGLDVGIDDCVQGRDDLEGIGVE